MTRGQGMQQQQPHRGLAGVILAAGVATALVIVAGTAVAAVVGNGSLSESGAAMLSTALGTAIGALATYLGGNRATDEHPESYVVSHRAELDPELGLDPRATDTDTQETAP